MGENSSKTPALIGFFCLLTALFVESYVYRMINTEGALRVDYRFTFFFGWSGWSLDEMLSPPMITIPLAINVFFLGMVFSSMYGLFTGKAKSSMGLAYVNIFTVILSGYYLFIVPITTWTDVLLYFPILSYTEFTLIQLYSISYGYILMCAGFFLTFPYSIQCYLKTYQAQKHEVPISELIESKIKQHSADLDVEAMIAKQELKLKFEQDGLDSIKKELLELTEQGGMVLD